MEGEGREDHTYAHTSRRDIAAKVVIERKGGGGGGRVGREAVSVIDADVSR
jgi:hypothetical protein